MKLLYVDCCISQRGENSRTARLCRSFLEAASECDPQLQIEQLDLTNMELQPFTVEMLNQRDARMREKKFEAPEYALARQFRDADGIVVGAPFWDLTFPAQLRIYIEHISANGITYYYDEKGPHGSCRAKWLVYLTTGGDYERAGSLGAACWEQLCVMYGIGRYDWLFAGGLDAAPEDAEKNLEAVCPKARALARMRMSSD